MFWPGRAPTLEGIFAATWTLRHAIETNTGGVGDPVQLVVLEPGQPPRELPEAELGEHQQTVRAAEDYMAAFPEQLRAGAAGDHAEPPAAPPP